MNLFLNVLYGRFTLFPLFGFAESIGEVGYNKSSVVVCPRVLNIVGKHFAIESTVAVQQVVYGKGNISLALKYFTADVKL